MEISVAKNEVIAAGRELVAKGLVARTWGNVSCRIDASRFAITPSGIGYERLTPEQVVVVDMQTLEHEGAVKPSSEKGIHACAYRLNPAANFIIHTHQSYATCLSVAGAPSLRPASEEAALLGGGIGVAEYGLPGTKKLMRHVARALEKGHSAILMKNHGALLTGADREEAFARAVALEKICARAAEPLPPMVDCAPDVIGRRAANGAPEIERLSEGEYVLSAQALEQLHAAVYRQFPAWGAILHARAPAVEQAMAQTDALPALLDDFAQMLGSDLRAATLGMDETGRIREAGVANAVKKLAGRNGVYLRGVGLVCCAGEPADCEALFTLTQKNALAYLQASRCGEIAPLSYLDKKLMRFLYTQKYAKKK